MTQAFGAKTGYPKPNGYLLEAIIYGYPKNKTDPVT